MSSSSDPRDWQIRYLPPGEFVVVDIDDEGRVTDVLETAFRRQVDAKACLDRMVADYLASEQGGA